MAYVMEPHARREASRLGEALEAVGEGVRVEGATLAALADQVMIAPCRSSGDAVLKLFLAPGSKPVGGEVRENDLSSGPVRLGSVDLQPAPQGAYTLAAGAGQVGNIVKGYTDAAKNLGLEVLNALNAGRIPDGWSTYNTGGPVTGDLEGMHPVLLTRLQAWASAVGEPYDVDSGYRSIEEQQRLRDAYLAGRGPLAAVPGSSMHNYGLASDGPHWRGKNPGRFGLAFTVPSEDWHVEPVEARQLRGVTPYGIAAPSIPVPPTIGGWPLATTAEGAMRMAYKAAIEGARGLSVDSPVPAIADTDLKSTVQDWYSCLRLSGSDDPWEIRCW